MSFALKGLIRAAVADDFSAVAAVKMAAARRYGEDYTTRPLPQALFALHQAQGSVKVAVEEGGNISGYSLAYPSGDDLYLHHLFVDISGGRRGVGSALLGEVLDRARMTGNRAVTLITGRDIPWNGPFYRRFGFVELGPVMPDYLRRNLDEDIEHFRPENFPFVINYPKFLPRVAMERLAT